ncbi:unnamed protein product [Rotaria sp. Silwood1]|nr:unnamed protein product [Rotaria sp. Silwood1]
MFNIANVMHLLMKLVMEKYPDCKQDELSSQDYEMADQLMITLELFINSSEIFDGNIVLEIDDYDDSDGEYNIESDDDEETYSVGSHFYSYKTMLDIVQFANTHLFSAVQRRYHLIKQRNQLTRSRKYVKQQGTKRQKLEKLD